ncbi:MAG: response regulator [Myxococcota bacterium]|nr:response regulator [Myxococcota bacterium]
MGATVLCVDHDRQLCQVVAKALEAQGFTVPTENDGARALERLRQEPPDLLLLDLMLPGLDGFAVLEELRKLPEPARQLPVILLSDFSPTPEYSSRAEALGAQALITKPVPLDDLTRRVVAALGEPKEEPPAGAPSARPRRTSGRALTGSLDRFSFPALIHHLHGLRASGVLELVQGRKRKWVQLRDGYPSAVRSNLVQECLGNYLERTGRISADVMRESLRRLKSGKGRLQGEILVAMEVLSEEEVSQALREQAEDKLYEVFAWKQGRFRFEFGATVPRASGLSRRSPANLILKGVRTRTPLERIDAWVGANREARLARGRQPFYRFQEVLLEPEEREWVQALTGDDVLREFADAPESRRRTVYGLVKTGLLELERGSTPRSEPAGAPPQPGPPPGVESEEEARLRAELARMAQRFAGRSYFEILEVSEGASETEIRAAYERIAAQAHPDRVNTSSEAVRRLAAEVFGHVERAFTTLSDPRKRGEYVLGIKKADREAARRADAERALEAEQEFQRGEASLRERAYEKALAQFGRALQLYPEDGEYHAHYGYALHLCHPDDVDMAQEAIEHVKRGIKLASDREKPYLLMGRLCKATGRAGAAEKMFTRAIQIQPNCVEALRELRLINMRRTRKKGLIGRFLRR